MSDARNVWLDPDDPPPPDVPIDEIIRRAEKLRRRLRRANALEYAAGAFVVVAFVAMAALDERLPAASRVGAAAIACAAVFVLTYLALRGAAGEVRRDETTLACYRAELEKRRALLAAVPRWYLAPFWPGMALFFGGFAVARWGDPDAMRASALSIGLAVLVNVGIVLSNRRAARRLADELERLPAPLDDGSDAPRP